MPKNYEILYEGAYPIVKYRLSQGERIKAESDAMIAMSPTVDVEGKMEGGILGGLGRAFLSNESFFFQHLTARRGPGEVLFGPVTPGGIVDVELDGSYDLLVQKDGFLGATQDVEVSTKMQNLLGGLFSGEGFFVLKISGRGTVFLSSYGAIHIISLGEKEEVIVDNGHLVAWAGYMKYKLEKAANGWISSITSGESLVCRFTGPGPVIIQTRNPSGFSGWLKKITGGRK
jgi:uncharacterized protein (TIGR00266 family)